MNPMAESYMNALATAKAKEIKKSSTDGDIFKMARQVADQAVESGVALEEDTTLRIYNALIAYRNSGEKNENQSDVHSN